LSNNSKNDSNIGIEELKQLLVVSAMITEYLFYSPKLLAQQTNEDYAA
jgi:hypothetical protein